MSGALDRLVDQLRQARATQRGAVSTAVPAVDPLARARGVGARVFDPVTGQEGEIIHVEARAVVLEAATA